MFALLGGLVGAAVARLSGGRFVTPQPVDPRAWRVISPVLDETIRDPLLGRGAQILDGDLVIRNRAFSAADVLVPQFTGAPARVDVQLGDSPGPVTLVLVTVDNGPRTLLRLGVDTWRADPGGPSGTDASAGGRWVVTSSAEGTLLETGSGPVRVASAPLAGVELTILDAEARVDSFRVSDAAGSALFSETFDGAGSSRGVLLAGAGIGAVAGASLGVSLVGGGVVMPLLLVLLPFAVVVPDESFWLWWIERLYLSRTPYWELAGGVLVAALLPGIALAALRSGWLSPVRGRVPLGGRAAWAAWALCALAVAGIASRDLGGVGLAAGVVAGALLAGGPAWLAARCGWNPLRLLLADLPGLVAVAALGWQAGLLWLVGWRLVWLVGSVEDFLEHAPGLGANLVLLTTLALPVGAELALRSTWLDEGWRPERLSGEKASASDWREALPFWDGRCGPDGADRSVRIAWAGGSSTGGAYQFRHEPGAFFPARVHASLCAGLPPDTSLRSYNFGDGGRDTHTISRSIDRILERSEPDVLVLYVGVNDILTRDHPLTRAEREAQLDRWTRSGTLVGLAGRSRLITGLGLLARPRPGGDGAGTVPEVPLPDAEANLRRVADATAARGTQLVLVTEQLRADFSGALGGYALVQEQVAGEYPHVVFFDAAEALASVPSEALMVDRNHLSRQGSQALADALLPEVARLSGLEAAVTPEASAPAP